MKSADPDPAARLVSRGLRVFLVGGFVFVLLPARVIDLVQSDSLRDQLAYVLSIVFFGWLTYRIAQALRRHGEPDDRNWSVDVAFYAVFIVVLAGLHIWDITQGFFDATDLIFTAIVVVILVNALVMRRLAAKRPPPPAARGTPAG